VLAGGYGSRGQTWPELGKVELPAKMDPGGASPLAGHLDLPAGIAMLHIGGESWFAQACLCELVGRRILGLAGPMKAGVRRQEAVLKQ
jgi:hypothetical protein